ncbi:G protein-coupled glucose receptor regulating Gpa2-domain-containing protein [Podospora aff. communis PSN243]|uniref:G protein-coupled glucose receptor regulating Gpa2-domain-containing protein n=1 Tax=Podospora aff. communis PSN243 TaxID=3040156 RepID=A0AAV9H3U8_9PEZI|nr:G protein-coupled glucose receptor regulating Gpa2-domain-containing protein [Podospora aff. communis PSN243]
MYRQRYITHILMILSLTFASVSVLSTLFTLYWFVRMRRGFRHELIMLLVQSDFVKSAAFVVFPIVGLARGNIESDSAFCQVSGFALALGIESSDIAVLLIALHSVMYIFRPRSGLYPYRRIAYLVYYLFPIVVASLAFIDGPGYENVGHYCYLRAGRGWRRMALSWIPRYVVGISIVVIYAFIYIYIRRRMYDYERRSSNSPPPPRRSQLPRITRHGLIPSMPNSRRGSGIDSIVDKQHHRRSDSTVSSLEDTHHATTAGRARGRTMPARPPIDWNWSGFQQPRSSVDNPFPEDAHDPLSPNRPDAPSTVPTPTPAYFPDANRAPSTPDIHGGDHDESSVTSSQTVWRRPISPKSPARPGTADRPPAHRANVSLPNILTMLRRGPSPHPHPPAPIEQDPHSPHHMVAASTVDSMPILISADQSDVARNRDKIRRQLRALFAYPLVYLIVWVFPFVSHVMGYDDAVRPGDPFWLLVLGIISLCVQGTVDCALFAAKEKPWRHARRGFWEAITSKLFWGWKENVWGDFGAAGRTREEMMVDGRLARQRRDGEIMAEQNLRASLPFSRKEVREWWDVDLPGFGPVHWDEVEERRDNRVKESGEAV